MKKLDMSLKVLNIVGFALIVYLIIHLGSIINNAETLEDRLRYIKPEEKFNVVAPEYLHEASDETNKVNYTYVPTYSHIYANNGQPLLLESTLSLRNTDSRNALVIHKVDYYSSSSELVNSYVSTPITIAALSSIEYLNPKDNKKGGVGAFYVVLWSSNNEDAKPIIESIMTNTSDNHQISYTSRGEVMPFSFH